MKGEIRKQTFSFPEEEWDERERVYYFGDYVAGLCLYYWRDSWLMLKSPGS